MMDWTVWGKDAAERAAKTAAQAIVVYVTAAGVSTVWDVDWRMALGSAALGAVASVLTSVLSLGGGDPNTASLVSDIRARRVA